MTQAHLMLGTRSVRRIGYGAMRLPDDPSAAEALLHHALDLGVDHFDTARYYGAANERLASVLHGAVRDDVLVATKVGWANGGTSPRPAPQPEDLIASVHENLRSLGVERLGLVNLRRGAAPGVPSVDVPIAEQLGALAGLCDQGLIESIGLSAVSRKELDDALALMPIACVQNMFSVFVRRDLDVVHRCAEVGSPSCRTSRSAADGPVNSRPWAVSQRATGRAPLKLRSPGFSRSAHTSCSSPAHQPPCTSRRTCERLTSGSARRIAPYWTPQPEPTTGSTPRTQSTNTDAGGVPNDEPLAGVFPAPQRICQRCSWRRPVTPAR